MRKEEEAVNPFVPTIMEIQMEKKMEITWKPYVPLRGIQGLYWVTTFHGSMKQSFSLTLMLQASEEHLHPLSLVAMATRTVTKTMAAAVPEAAAMPTSKDQQCDDLPDYPGTPM